VCSGPQSVSVHGREVSCLCFAVFGALAVVKAAVVVGLRWVAHVVHLASCFGFCCFLCRCQLEVQASFCTVAILAQGTSWAVAVTQAFFVRPRCGVCICMPLGVVSDLFVLFGWRVVGAWFPHICLAVSRFN